MDKKKRCYIYTRVSTEMQTEGFSLDAQRDKILGYAQYQDIQVVEEFCDAGRSGKNVTGRPEFQHMMAKIQSGKDPVDFVLVFKLSRFGRNAADVLSNLQTMQDYGTNLICVDDNIDSSKDSGKLMIAVLSAVAEIERENILIQSMAGRRQKAREGRWNGGQAPYGYTIDKEKGILVVNPDEAEIVKLIYDRFIFDHMGYNKIAKWLNDNGYTRKTRKNLKYEAFTGTFIKSVLDNPVYAGKIAYGRRAHEKIQGARNEYRIVKQDEYETYEGQHEAIIDPEKWDAVHERRLETGKKREKTHSLDHAHVLSGIVRCPVCGAQMYGSVNRKKRKDGTYYPDQWYYVCKYRKAQRGKECSFRRQPQQKIVDREVIAVIADTLRNPNFAAIMQEVMNERTDEETLKARREALTKSREQYAAAKDKLAERLDTLDYTDPAYDMKYADMEKRLDGLYADIARVDEDISDVDRSLADARSAQATIETAYEWLEFCSNNLDTLDDAAKREIVEGFVERVDIFPERQPDGRWVKSIDFCFPVVLDGTELTHWSRNESNVETVVLLSKLHAKHHIEVELHMDEMDLTAAESKATYEEIKAYVLEHSGFKVSNLYIAQVKQKYGIIERECYNKPKSEDSRQPKCPSEKEAAITEALKYFKMI